MDLSGALIRMIVGGVAVLGLCLTIYVMKLKNDSLTIERDNAKAAVKAYQSTLSAYQAQYAAQARALNSEKGREIARQEKLLKTLNLAGELNEAENKPLSPGVIAVINSMYESAGAPAAGKAKH